VRKLISIFNGLIIGGTALGVGILSAIFFLGSYDDYVALRDQLPWSFLIRTSIGIAFGLLMMAILVLLNWILNTGINSGSPINLLRLFLWGMLIIITGVSIGSGYFFGWISF
jgi:hypothetical protein